MKTRTYCFPRNTPFWDRCDRTGDCWLWKGPVLNSGYGHAYRDGKAMLAHRLAWELAHGQPIPEGMQVCHRCDVRLCVRPEHLFLGTQRDNILDAVAKGRTGARMQPESVLRGERHPGARLTETEVRAIRALPSNVPLRVIAADYGISIGHAHRVRRGQSWTSLTFLLLLTLLVWGIAEGGAE